MSVDDKTSLKAGVTFSYKEGINYTCSNKADDEIFNLNCNTAGFKFDISCPSKINFKVSLSCILELISIIQV